MGRTVTNPTTLSGILGGLRGLSSPLMVLGTLADPSTFLSSYQAHANLSRRKQGPVVRTTWLNASFGRKSLQQKSRFLATSIFREWMDQQLYGEPHWSHVKYSTTNPKNGEVQAG